MATYVNDLRLKEISTGDESGTWGTSTNTNLELIGEALGYATEQSFGSDADATTTVADGASDPARAMYFKVTSAGNLTATRTLTIAPNTVSRVMFIENATSGSQSIAISQGSGANVTIATGKTAIVYLDGAGSGAAVVDAMAGVDPGVTDTLAEVLTAGNATGGTDIAVGTGDDVTFADSSKAIFGAGSDLQIYHDGSNSYVDDQGTGALFLKTNGTGVFLYSGSEALATFNLNGASNLYYDNGLKLSTTSTGIDVTGSVTADGLTVSNSSLQVKLEELDGTNNPRLVTYFDSSGTHLQHTWSSGADSLFLEYGGSEGSGTKALGIQGGDISFYEDTGTTPKLFWDASTERLGLGTSAPYGALTVDTANGILTIANGNTSGGTKIQAWGATQSDGYLAIEGNTKEYMRIDASGNVGIGTSSVTNALGWASVAQVGGANPALSLKNTSNVQWDISNFGGTFAVYNGSNQRLRIDSSGNVSVSSSAGLIENAVGVFMLPAGELRVKDSTEDGTAQISTYNNNVTADAEQFFVGNNLADVDIGNKRGALKFFANSTTERMRIDTSGNFLIGSTNNSNESDEGFKLKPNGEGTNKPRLSISTAGYQTETCLSIYSTAVTAFRFFVDAAGTISAVNTTISSISDERVKENVRDLDDGLDKVLQLQPRKFDWKQGQGRDISNDRGFIAQEFEQVFPDMIEEWKDEAPEGEEPYKAINANLIPTLVKAIQEQQETITALEARITQLENS